MILAAFGGVFQWSTAVTTTLTGNTNLITSTSTTVSTSKNTTTTFNTSRSTTTTFTTSASFSTSVTTSKTTSRITLAAVNNNVYGYPDFCVTYTGLFGDNYNYYYNSYQGETFAATLDKRSGGVGFVYRLGAYRGVRDGLNTYEITREQYLSTSFTTFFSTNRTTTTYFNTSRSTTTVFSTSRSTTTTFNTTRSTNTTVNTTLNTTINTTRLTSFY